jgi:aspartate 1-decarboxylase
MTYAQFAPEELHTYSPTVVLVDDQNRLVEVRRYSDFLEKAHAIHNGTPSLF